MFGYIFFAVKSVYITCILKHPMTVELDITRTLYKAKSSV